MENQTHLDMAEEPHNLKHKECQAELLEKLQEASKPLQARKTITEHERNNLNEIVTSHKQLRKVKLQHQLIACRREQEYLEFLLKYTNDN